MNTHHRSLCVTLAAFVVGVFIFAPQPNASAAPQRALEGELRVLREAEVPPEGDATRSDTATSDTATSDTATSGTATSGKEIRDAEANATGESRNEADEPPSAAVRVRGQEAVERTAPKPRRNQLVSAPLLIPTAGDAESGTRDEDTTPKHTRHGAYCRHCARRTSLVFGANAGFGLPTKHSALESNTQRVVSGLSFAPPGLSLSAAIPLGRRWDLVPRFAAQIVWGGDELKLVPSVELRARVFPGAPNRRWEEYFVFGVGYGELHHLVHPEEISGPNEGIQAPLQSAAAGPFRVLGAMGARWNSSGRIAVDIEAVPYILLPNWSVHLEISVGLAIKL